MTEQILESPVDQLGKLEANQLCELVPGLKSQANLLRACQNAGALWAVVRQMILLEEQERDGMSDEGFESQWREQRWGGQVEQAFIAARNRFETVSFWRLIAPTKGIAMETYYRLCNRETTFRELEEAFIGSSETQKTSIREELPFSSVDLVKKKPLIRLAKTLAKTLRDSPPGVTRPPIRHGNDFIVVQLKRLHTPRLDVHTRKSLLLEMESLWLDEELLRRLERLKKN